MRHRLLVIAVLMVISIPVLPQFRMRIARLTGMDAPIVVPAEGWKIVQPTNVGSSWGVMDMPRGIQPPLSSRLTAPLVGTLEKLKGRGNALERRRFPGEVSAIADRSSCDQAARRLVVLSDMVSDVTVGAMASSEATESGQGRLTGVVTDAQGAAMPGVPMTITSSVAGSMMSYADTGGVFRPFSLMPGTYDVKIELTGFQTVNRENVVVLVGQTTHLDFQMVASLAENVTGASTSVSSDGLRGASTARDANNSLTRAFLSGINLGDPGDIGARDYKSSSSDQGSFAGWVMDTTSGVLPGVNVSAVCSETNLTRSVVTDALGGFTFPELPVCLYRVTTELPGFKTIARDVPVVAKGVAKVDFKLEVGVQSETNIVEALPTLVEFSDNNNRVDSRRIEAMPLSGPDFNSLLSVTPGQEHHSGGGFQGVNVGGARTAANNFMIDGISNNDRYNGDTVLNSPAVVGVPATLIPIDAIGGFTVQQTPSAEFGVKGGGNTPHGTGYYFQHDDWTHSPNFEPLVSLSRALTTGVDRGWYALDLARLQGAGPGKLELDFTSLTGEHRAFQLSESAALTSGGVAWIYFNHPGSLRVWSSPRSGEPTIRCVALGELSPRMTDVAFARIFLGIVLLADVIPITLWILGICFVEAVTWRVTRLLPKHLRGRARRHVGVALTVTEWGGVAYYTALTAKDLLLQLGVVFVV